MVVSTSSLNEDVARLGDAIFNSSNALAETTKRSNAHGILEEVIIYRWPKYVRQDEKLMMLSLLTACGRSNDPSHSKWQSWVLSYSVLCFDDFEHRIRAEGNRELVFRDLPESFIQTARSLLQQMGDASSETDQSLLQAKENMIFPERFPTVSTGHLDTDLQLCDTIPAIFGYNSLLLFMAGKRMNDLNQRAVAEARPQAIINTYKAENAAFILTGEGKIDPNNYSMINLCWTKSQAAKKAIFYEVAAFAKNSSQAQMVTYTTVKLLEFVGMQPAVYIHKFLLANPWSVQISTIRAPLAKYLESLREVARAPAYIQPYYKVIYGESTKAFHRNSLLNLTAVAIAYERITNPTMANYTMGDGADSALNAFDAEATAKGLSAIGMKVGNVDNE